MPERIQLSRRTELEIHLISMGERGTRTLCCNRSTLDFPTGATFTFTDGLVNCKAADDG